MTTTPEPTTPEPTTPDPEDVAALQDVLAGEHAAVYLHGLLGARTSQSAAPALYDTIQAAYVAHRDLRDALVGELAALGAQPVAPATAYQAPAGIALDTTEGITAAALAIETACAATQAAAVGRAAGEVRSRVIGWLQTTAVRELAFRGTPEMFPGAGEHADR